MFTLFLIEDRVLKTKTLVVSDKRFSVFVEDIKDRKQKNIEELQSSPDIAYIQNKMKQYQKVYKVDDKNLINPHKVKLTPRDRIRFRIKRKKVYQSSATRKLRSEMNMGEKNPMWGRKQSANACRINSIKRRNRFYQPHTTPHTQETKDKYREKRKGWKPNTGKKWAYDPYTYDEKFVDAKHPLPPGWFYGRSPYTKEKINDTYERKNRWQRQQHSSQQRF